MMLFYVTFKFITIIRLKILGYNVWQSEKMETVVMFLSVHVFFLSTWAICYWYCKDNEEV